MSKPVKELLRKELARRFEGVTSLAVVGFTGIDAVSTHRVRGRLREKDIRLTVVKNSIARQAFDAVGLGQAKDLLDGPCAVAFANDSDAVGVVEVVRELLDIGKDVPNLTVKAALLDGEVFGAERIRELSQFPTREEAVRLALACVLSPGAKLAGCLIGPAATIAGLVKAIQNIREQEGESSGEQAA